MKQKSLKLGSSLTRNESKNVNGGKIKIKNAGCHNQIDGLYNKCVNSNCYSRGTGACDQTDSRVCMADAIDYCCCTSATGICTTDGDCGIHGL